MAVIDSNSGDGVLISDGASATISSNTISNNNGAGVRDESSQPVDLYDNTISGNSGGNVAYSGDIYLRGSSSNDTLIGGDGNDTLDGGQGDDELTGAAGNDLFVFGANSGNDTITDFSHDDDTIDLSGSAVGHNTFSDLQITQNGNDTLINLGSGNTITLLNTASSSLDSSDFVFAS